MIYEPYPYQQYCAARIVTDAAVGLFLDMGLGKTVITLDAINTLRYDRWAVQRVLIIAPKKVAEGKALSKVFTSEEEILELVEKTILFFRDEGISGERFADTINRLGFEYVEDKLLNGKLDKEKVMKKTVIGGATC